VSASVLYMSMSLDGYIAGPDDGPGNPGGDGFMRLHEWLATADGDSGRPPGPAGEMHDEMEATGAVLVGRRTASRPVTTKAIITACRSWWSATGRRLPRWPAVRR